MSGSNVEDEYVFLRERSWEHPLESVSVCIDEGRKVRSDRSVRFHSRVNHEYHMGKWGRCVYCDNGIPIKEEEK